MYLALPCLSSRLYEVAVLYNALPDSLDAAADNVVGALLVVVLHKIDPVIPTHLLSPSLRLDLPPSSLADACSPAVQKGTSPSSSVPVGGIPIFIRSFFDAVRQVAEVNPDFATGIPREVRATDLAEFLRKFPFVADPVGVQVQRVIPANFSRLRIDFQRGFLADREPLLNFGLLARRPLLDRNVGE